jgi:glutaminyl-peptide cyclotransferase
MWCSPINKKQIETGAISKKSDLMHSGQNKSRLSAYSCYLILLSTILLTACGGEKKKPEETVAHTVAVPQFNADSAYFFVQRQVAFGPRVPNTPAHRKAGDYLVQQLKRYGAEVTTQEFSAVTFDNQKVSLKNIIASFSPEKKKRILLAAHWDTRPFADKDKEKPNAPFDGANDGGSGVGVLLEIARVLSSNPLPDTGIDIILFDGEDWGEKEGEQSTRPLPPGFTEWWCLGSQYWARNKHQPKYSAYFGILLDMVGGKNAQFAREGYSLEYAPSVVRKVWKTAAQLGFSHIFINQKTGPVTDDHKFVNEIAKIPMVDIISFDPATGFGDFHHTQKDNMEIISTETLMAVGQTVLQVIYYE